MNCLIDFLMDENQKKLITIIQNREETYDKALESYQKLFIAELEYCMNTELRKWNHFDDTLGCPCRCGNRSCTYIDSCRNFYSVINNIHKDKICSFFERLLEVYRHWINAQTVFALNMLENLLMEYNLLTCDSGNNALLISDLNERVLFRARVSSDFLNKAELFHVPFDKRYNIRNERFSLSGQPILYLGSSIAGIAEEIDVNLDDYDRLNNFKVASYEFKETSVRMIFDLRCNIFSDLRNYANPTFTEQKFFRNILASVCSFQKRKELSDYDFKEEYVIPQMVAQILKRNNYDGICYYSTKPFDGYEIEVNDSMLSKPEMNMMYRENFAIFTNECGNEKYDFNLLSDLERSMPIVLDLDTERRHVDEDLHKLRDAITTRANETNGPLLSGRASKKKADDIIDFYDRVIKKIKCNGIEYGKTIFGQAQIQLLSGILNRLLVEIQEPIPAREECNKAAPNSTEKIYTCDADGNVREEATYSNVHTQGRLHKAALGFILCKDMVVMGLIEAGQNKYFYNHDREKIFSGTSIEYVPGEPIGKFIHRSSNWNKNDMCFENNFEYIEVFCQVANDLGADALNSMNKMEAKALKERFVDQYNSFHELMRQALPILFLEQKKREMENKEQETSIQTKMKQERT